jgi:hypothetical protein
MGDESPSNNTNFDQIITNFDQIYCYFFTFLSFDFKSYHIVYNKKLKFIQIFKSFNVSMQRVWELRLILYT